MNKSEVLKFIDQLPILILTTMNGNQPETRALINIRNIGIAPHLTGFFNKNDRILFITNTHTDKIEQIRKNPIAALYSHSNDFSGLLLIGKIHEITDKETIDVLWDDSWAHYYPDGKDGGDFSVIEFMPENFKSYSGKDFSKKSGNIKN
jgi:general stress protein 26